MKKVLFILIPVLLISLLIGSYFLYSYTEVFGKKIIPINIKSSSIKYSIDRGLLVDRDGKKIDLEQEIKLSSSQLKKISSLLKGVKKNKDNKSNKEFIANVVINKDYIIYIGEKYGYIENNKNKTNVKIPNSLYNYVYNLIEDNNEKIFEKLDFSKVLIHSNGSRIEVTNKDNLNVLKSAIMNHVVDIESDFSTYNNGYKYWLVLDDNIRVFIYSNNVGYISNSQDSKLNKFVIFKEDVCDIIDKIYSVSTAKNEEEKK